MRGSDIIYSVLCHNGISYCYSEFQYIGSISMTHWQINSAGIAFVIDYDDVATICITECDCERVGKGHIIEILVFQLVSAIHTAVELTIYG